MSQVTEARTDAEGLQRCREASAAVVVIDFLMAEMHGLELNASLAGGFSDGSGRTNRVPIPGFIAW